MREDAPDATYSSSFGLCGCYCVFHFCRQCPPSGSPPIVAERSSTIRTGFLGRRVRPASRFVIDGACPFVMHIGGWDASPWTSLPPPSRAVLGFFTLPGIKRRMGGTAASPAATQSMMEIYPAPLRSWIDRHGGLTPKMIFLRGRELAGMVSTCGAVLARVARRK